MIIVNNIVNNIMFMTPLLGIDKFYNSYWYVCCDTDEIYIKGFYLLNYNNGKYTLAVIVNVERNSTSTSYEIDIIGELVSDYIDDYERVKNIILRNKKISKLI